VDANDRILLARIDEKVTTLLKRDSDHEKRLRALERGQWFVGGAAAVISMLVAYFTKRAGL